MARNQSNSYNGELFFSPAGAHAAETPAVASLQLVKAGRFPKYKLVGVDFKVLLHTEGNSELVECWISECVLSSHHFLSHQLAEELKGETGSVVVPKYDEGDTQSMVTGAVNFGEESEAACRREGHEEIGLDATEIRRVDKTTVMTSKGEAEATYYVGRMSSNPGPQAAAKGNDDRSRLICCVPIVKDPSDVIARCRMVSKDTAGKTVMVIPMNDYLQLLAAFNRADPRPRASSSSHRSSYGASSSSHRSSYGASSSSRHGSYGASSSSRHGSYGASSSSRHGSYGASDDSYHPYSRSSS